MKLYAIKTAAIDREELPEQERFYHLHTIIPHGGEPESFYGYTHIFQRGVALTTFFSREEAQHYIDCEIKKIEHDPQSYSITYPKFDCFYNFGDHEIVKIGEIK